MIVPPSGVRVWLATGVTDMRRGMNGLALQVQQALGGIRMAAIFMCSVASAAICSRFSGMTAWACRSTPNVLSEGALFGQPRRKVLFQSPVPNSATCWKGLIGETRNELGDRKRRDKAGKNCRRAQICSANQGVAVIH
jgi:IS66 Orf2 like protein